MLRSEPFYWDAIRSIVSSTPANDTFKSFTDNDIRYFGRIYDFYVPWGELSHAERDRAVARLEELKSECTLTEPICISAPPYLYNEQQRKALDAVAPHFSLDIPEKLVGSCRAHWIRNEVSPFQTGLDLAKDVSLLEPWAKIHGLAVLWILQL